MSLLGSFVRIALCVVTLAATSLRADDGIVGDPSAVPPPPAVEQDWSVPAPNFTQYTLYPANPSDRMLLITYSNQAEIWSLSQKKALRTLDAKLRLMKSEVGAISCDGERAAIAPEAYSSGAVEVWDLGTGKFVQRLEAGNFQERRVEFVEFAGPRRLVTYPGKHGKLSVTLWDVDTGEVLRSPLVPVELANEAFAVSPGGRYLAVAGRHKNQLFLFDLETGQLARQIIWDKAASGGFWDDCKGLAFSQDGRELAALFRGRPAGHLRVWDVVEDRLLIDDPVQADPVAGIHGFPSYNGRRLTWMPDGSGWLCFGYFLVDRATLETRLTLKLPAGRMIPDIRPVANNRLVYYSQHPQPSLKAVSIPALFDPKAAATERPLLKPGDEIRVHVELGDVRTEEKEELIATLERIFAERAQQAGLVPAEEAAVRLVARYSEKEGPMLKLQPLPRLPRLPFPTVQPPSNEPGQGTGFLISATGHVATCAHVVGNAPEMIVQIGMEKHTAKVLAKDAKLDLAILKFDAADLPFLRVRDSANYELGEEVRAVGFPLSDVLGNTLKVTKGSLSGIVRKDEQDLFMIDAVVNPGNSGGPLLDRSGRAIGVASAKLVGPAVERVGLCVPSSLLRRFASEQKIDLPADAEEPPLVGNEFTRKLEATVVMVVPVGSGTVPSTEIACHLEWRHRDRTEPLWQSDVNSGRGLIVQGAITEKSVRQAAIQNFKNAVGALVLPYFVSADGSRTVPGILDLSER